MTAEAIAKCYLSDKQYAHTERVVGLCERFAESFSQIDKKTLMDAAWLHDIGKAFVKKKKRAKKHAKRKVVNEALKSVGWARNCAEVSYIIHRHKGKFRPQKHIIECSILRICDKLDKYNKDEKKHPKQYCEKSMKKIRRVLCQEDLQKFEKIYKNERSKLSYSRIKRKIMRETFLSTKLLEN